MPDQRLTPFSAGGAERLLDKARAFRFGLVGIASTITYLGIVNLLAIPVGPLSAFEAHLIGLSSSIGLSYVGHHAFTYARKGGHGVYFRRFAVITAALFILTSALAYACDRFLHLPAAIISGLVTVLYPCGSYLGHTLWTFAGERANPSAPLPR
jgi:putative flippase GtrA